MSEKNSRKQEIKDGVLIDVTATAKRVGFSSPVALTRCCGLNMWPFPTELMVTDDYTTDERAEHGRGAADHDRDEELDRELERLTPCRAVASRVDEHEARAGHARRTAR